MPTPTPSLVSWTPEECGVDGDAGSFSKGEPVFVRLNTDRHQVSERKGKC